MKPVNEFNPYLTQRPLVGKVHAYIVLFTKDKTCYKPVVLT